MEDLGSNRDRRLDRWRIRRRGPDTPVPLTELIAKGGQVKAAVQGPPMVTTATNNLYVEYQKKLYICRVAFWTNLTGNPGRTKSEDADVNVCWAIE